MLWPPTTPVTESMRHALPLRIEAKKCKTRRSFSQCVGNFNFAVKVASMPTAHDWITGYTRAKFFFGAKRTVEKNCSYEEALHRRRRSSKLSLALHLFAQW